MLYFAVVAAVFALVVSFQNVLLSRRLEHWRDLYLGLRHDYAELHQQRSVFGNIYRECPRCYLSQEAAEDWGGRLVGKARGAASEWELVKAARKPVLATDATPAGRMAIADQKLLTVKQWRAAHMINEEEYERTRKAIFEELNALGQARGGTPPKDAA